VSEKRDDTPEQLQWLHWLCTQNPAQSPHKDTDAPWRARRGALGERIRLWGQPSCGSRAAGSHSAFAYTRGVPDTPRCPHCEAPIEQAETTEVVSPTQGGFRMILVACPSRQRIIGVGGSLHRAVRSPNSVWSRNACGRPAAGYVDSRHDRAKRTNLHPGAGLALVPGVRLSALTPQSRGGCPAPSVCKGPAGASGNRTRGGPSVELSPPGHAAVWQGPPPSTRGSCSGYSRVNASTSLRATAASSLRGVCFSGPCRATVIWFEPIRPRSERQIITGGRCSAGLAPATSLRTIRASQPLGASRPLSRGQSAALALNAADRQNARWCAQDDER
jgi:hypothetical protein